MEPQKEYYTIFRNADNHAKSPHCCRFFFTKFTVFKEKDTDHICSKFCYDIRFNLKITTI